MRFERSMLSCRISRAGLWSSCKHWTLSWSSDRYWSSSRSRSRTLPMTGNGSWSRQYPDSWPIHWSRQVQILDQFNFCGLVQWRDIELGGSPYLFMQSLQYHVASYIPVRHAFSRMSTNKYCAFGAIWNCGAFCFSPRPCLHGSAVIKAFSCENNSMG